jgi:hypothetical protein
MSNVNSLELAQCKCALNYFRQGEICLQCSTNHAPHTTTGGNIGITNPAAGCLCTAGTHYQISEPDFSQEMKKIDPNDRNICVPCPAGADCSSKNGIRLQEISARNGYWRPDLNQDIFNPCVDGTSLTSQLALDRCCPLDPVTNVSICKMNMNRTSNTSTNDPDAQCQFGYSGPFCTVCIDSHVKQGNKCIVCNGTTSVMNVVYAVLGMMFLMYIIFVVLFCKAKEETEEELQKQAKKQKKGCCGGINKKPNKATRPSKKKRKSLVKTKTEKIQDSRSSTAATRFASDQLLVGRVQTGSKSSSDAAYHSDAQIVIDRIKVIYGWLQIFTALTFTFDAVPWPIELRAFSVGLNFINLDIGTLLSGSSCSFAIGYLDRMAIHAAVPLVLLAVLIFARLPAYVLRKKHRREQRAFLIKMICSFALILYPGLCTRLFSSLKVIAVKGFDSDTHSGTVLAVDNNIEYLGAVHMPYVYLTIASMVLYVLGVPLMVFFALQMNKKYLSAHGHSAEEIHLHHAVVDKFGTLYLQ